MRLRKKARLRKKKKNSNVPTEHGRSYVMYIHPCLSIKRTPVLQFASLIQSQLLFIVTMLLAVSVYGFWVWYVTCPAFLGKYEQNKRKEQVQSASLAIPEY